MSKDNRRFPRIILGRLSESLKVVAEAKVVKVDDTDSNQDVFDISYDSVAFLRPEGSFQQGQLVEFELKLSGYPVAELFGEVVRLGADLVAVQLRNVPGETRMILEGFLKDKIIGHNTYLVAKEFYTKKEDFSHWYHGPNATNIVIWRDGGSIAKSILELDNHVLAYMDGNWSMSASRRDPANAYDDYGVLFSEKSQAPVSALLFEKAINIVGQMLVTLPPHQRTVLQVLLDDLSERPGKG